MLGLSSIFLFNFFLHVFCNSTKTSANISDIENADSAANNLHVPARHAWPDLPNRLCIWYRQCRQCRQWPTKKTLKTYNIGHSIEKLSAPQRLFPVPWQLIWRGPAPIGEFLTNPWFTFDITLLQRLTIIESPTTDDYDYYDEFSQVTSTSFHNSKISLLTPFPPSSLWTPPTLTRTCATLLLVRWTQGMLTHARSATRSSRALGNWGTYHISWKHQLQK